MEAGEIVDVSDASEASGVNAGTESGLAGDDLPGLFHAADRASLSGQSAALRWNRVRLVGAICAAAGGAFSWAVGHIDGWAVIGLAGFVAALIAELVLLTQQPERDWYAGRAVAESTKTLAWKYAVAGAPFVEALPGPAARELFVDRLAAVSAKGRDRIIVSSTLPVAVTDAMTALRGRSLQVRKAVYLRNRIGDQQDWYARKATWNKSRATAWRLTLIGGEVVAVLVAAGRVFGAWHADWSGILAAVVASGAAWLGLRQHSELASAYSIAANELAMATERLRDATEDEWPHAVADAEEAISREHTMWLASRSDRST